jgi:hypothetical protein
VVNATPRPLYPRKTPDTNCIGGWVGPKAGLDGCGNSRPLPVIFCILLYSVLHPYLCLCLDCPAICLLSLLTTQTSMPPAGLESAIPASDRPQTRIRPPGHWDRHMLHLRIRSPDRPTSSESLYRLSKPCPLCVAVTIYKSQTLGARLAAWDARRVLVTQYCHLLTGTRSLHNTKHWYCSI